MTLQANTRLTAAETALVEAYNMQISDLPGDAEVLSARDRMLDDLKTGGLPTRRIESWHYTDLKTLVKTWPALEGADTAQALAVEKVGKFGEVFFLKRHHAFEYRHRSVGAHLLHNIMRHLRYALFGYLTEISGKHRSDEGVDDGLNEWFDVFL